jgi:hypothetical protein
MEEEDGTDNVMEQVTHGKPENGREDRNTKRTQMDDRIVDADAAQRSVCVDRITPN